MLIIRTSTGEVVEVEEGEGEEMAGEKVAVTNSGMIEDLHNRLDGYVVTFE